MRALAASATWMFRWEVESHSSDKVYIVGMKTDGTWGCDCPAWKFHKAPKPNCKHILGVQAQEQRVEKSPTMPVPQLIPTALPTPAPYYVIQTRRAIKLED